MAPDMADQDKSASRAGRSPRAARKKRKAALIVLAPEGEPEEQTMARVSLDPVVLASSFLSEVHKCGVTECVAEVGKHAQAVTTGNLSRLEQMLTAQAHSLDALFYSLVRRARANIVEGYVGVGETYMKLALRTQAQCRATAEGIATIKNPPALAFVRQANIAAGPQQVNNAPAPAPSRVRETENQPSKLLEAKDGERLDTGAASAAGRANQELEAVGAIHRAEDAGGQSTRFA
jgi:hypothetical protein